MELALLTLLGLTLTRPLTMPPIRAALIVALVAMALQHSRHQVLLGILAPMLLARPSRRRSGGSLADQIRQVVRFALVRRPRGGAGDRAPRLRRRRADRRRGDADFGVERRFARSDGGPC